MTEPMGFVKELRRFKRAKLKNRKRKAKKEARYDDRHSLFKIDALEDRILLSADPILGEVQSLIVDDITSRNNEIVHETLISDKEIQEESLVVEYEEEESINLDTKQLDGNEVTVSLSPNDNNAIEPSTDEADPKNSNEETPLELDVEDATQEDVISLEVDAVKDTEETTQEELQSVEVDKETISDLPDTLEVLKSPQTLESPLEIKDDRQKESDYTIEVASSPTEELDEEIPVDDIDLNPDNQDLITLLNDAYFKSADDATAPPTFQELEESGFGYYSEEKSAFIVDTHYLEEQGLLEEGSTLIVGEDMILGGSGILNLNIINENIFSPGYSPGKLAIDGNYTQSGTLLIELGGTVAASEADSVSQPDKYDNVAVTGDLDLAGTLDVVFYDGFETQLGDVFEIMTYGGDSTGAFTDATGLYGFGDGSLYLDIDRLDDRIVLTTTDVGEIVFDIDDVDAQNDLGLYYNQDYFALTTNTFEVTGKLSIEDYVYIEGAFSFNIGGTETVTVATGISSNLLPLLEGAGDVQAEVTNVEVSVLDLGITNANIFVGINGDYNDSLDDDAIGVVIDDLDLGLTMMSVLSVDSVTNSTIEKGLLKHHFYALSGHADSGKVVGIDEFEGELDDIDISLNSGFESKALSLLQKIDIPDISIPSISLGDFDIPEFNLPTAAFPDLTIAMPSLSLGTIALPTITLPGLDINIALPDIVLPNIDFPDIVIPDFYDLSRLSFDLPDITIPSIELPSIDIPELGFSITLPSIDIPTISIPSFDIDWNLPTFDIPAISLPDIVFPDLSFPEFELPSITLPTLTLPSFSIPDIQIPSIELPDFALSIAIPDISIPDIVIPEIAIPNLDALADLYLKLQLKKLWNPVVDFQESFGVNGHQITAGGETINIDYDGNYRIGVDVAQGKLRVDEFLYLQGGFSFEKGPTYAVDIATGLPANIIDTIESIDPLKTATEAILGVAAAGSTLSTFNDVEVESMTIGGSDLQAFAGIGGPYKYDADLSVDADNDGNYYNDWEYNTDAIGVTIDDLDFAMAIMETTSPIINPVLDEFIAVKATAEFGGLVGFDDVLVFEAHDIEININDGPEWPGGYGPAVIDWAGSFNETGPNEDTNDNGIIEDGFRVSTGGDTSVLIDHDGNQRIGVDVGQAKLQVSEFLYLQGGFAFEKGPTYRVDIATGLPADAISAINTIPELKTATDAILGVAAAGSTLSTLNDVEVASMTIGGSNLQSFSGIGGPYKYDADLSVDADNDGNYYNDWEYNTDAIGVTIDNLDFAMVIMDTTSPIINPVLDQFIAIKATAEFGGLVGFGDYLKVEAYDIEININDGPEWPLGYGPAVIDWAGSFNETGTNVDTNGNGIIEDGFRLSTGGGTSMLIDYDGNQRIGVDIGQALLQVDEFIYLQGSFAFEQGPTHMIESNLGDVGDLINAIPDVTIPAEHEVATLQVGGSDLQGFAGIGGPYKYDADLRVDADNDGNFYNDWVYNTDAIGVVIEDVTFGMALMSPTILPDSSYLSYLTLKADIGNASLMGLDDYLTADLEDISINVNTSISSLVPAQASLALRMPYIDYVTSFGPEGFSVNTGGDSDPVVFNYDNEIVQLKVGYFEGAMLGLIQVSGSFAVTKKGSEEVTLSDGSKESVMSLALGFNDLYGFVGLPGDDGKGYWVDSNNSGRIDSTDTPSTSAIGFAIEDLDLGLVVMRTADLTVAVPTIYAGLSADMEALGLVGVDPANLQATITSFELEANLSTDPNKFVNFSISGAMGGAYQIDTGNPAAPIELTSTSLLISLSGAMDINIRDLVTVNALIDLTVTADSITLFLDGDGRVGKVGDFGLDMHATGLLVIDNDGLALLASITGTVDLGDIASLAVTKFTLAINTTNKDVIYTVPEKFQSKVDYTKLPDGFKQTSGGNIQLIIPQKAPSFETDSSTFYVMLNAEATLTVMNTVDLYGEFNFLFSDVRVEMNVGAVLQVSGLSEVAAVGTLGVVSDGIYGAIEIGGDPALGGATLISTSFFTLQGGFLLQLNTTSNKQTVRSIVNNADGSFKEFSTVNLDASYLRIAGSASLTFAGGIMAQGYADIIVTPSRTYMALDMSLSLSTFGTYSLTGEMLIVDEGATTAFALKTTFAMNFSVGSVLNLNTTATLQINTSNTTNYLGVVKNTTFDLSLAGDFTVLAIRGTLSGGMSLVNDVFTVNIAGSVDFFGVVNIAISGYFSSNGNFAINGGIGISIDFGPFNASATLTLALTHNSLGISATGSVSFMGVGGLDLAASFELGANYVRVTASVSVTLEVTLWYPDPSWDDPFNWSSYKIDETFTASGSFIWTWGPPPLLATKSGSTLILHAGETYGVLKGPDYVQYTSDNFTVQQSGGIVTVTSLGASESYSGISKIYMDAGNSSDQLFVFDGVTADIEFYGGNSDDKVYLFGGGAGSVIRGGDDNDNIFGQGASGTKYYGDGGNDTYYSNSSRNAWIDMGIGTNTIVAGNGHNTIYAGAGSTNTIRSGQGSTYNGQAGSNVIHLTGGTQTVTTYGGIDTINFVAGQHTILSMGGGRDTINYTAASSQIFKLSDTNGRHKLEHGANIITFDNSTDQVNLKDNISEMIVQSVNNPYTVWGDPQYSGTRNGTSLDLQTSNVLNIENFKYTAPTATLSITASQGIKGTIFTEVAGMSVNNNSNSSNADIVIVEKDDLNLVNTGVNSSSGDIAISLNSAYALLTLEAGTIKADQNIIIVADDIDFNSGAYTVRGQGLLTLQSYTDNITYHLGLTAQNNLGNDYSPNGKNAYFYLSLKDFAAFNTSAFSHFNFGKNATVATMIIGGVTLPGNATFNANTIKVSGDLTLSNNLILNASIMDVGSGATVRATNIYHNISESLLVSGSVIGGDLVDIAIANTVGSFSLTTALGSQISTVNSNSKIIIDTKASIKLDGEITANATGSNIAIDTGRDLLQNGNITANAAVSVDAENNITMKAGTTTTSTQGDIIYDAANIMALSLLSTGGDVTLLAGEIIDNNLNDLNIIGHILNVNAIGFGVVNNALETTVHTLMATVGNKGLYLTESDDIIINGVIANLGNVVILAAGTMTVSQASSAKNISLRSIGNLTVNAKIAATNNIFIGSGATVTLGETLTSTAGNITIDAQTAINQNANISTLTDAKTIDLLVQAGSIAMAQGTEIQTTNGDIRVEANDSIITELITTTGNVSLIAQTGSITNLDESSLVSANALNFQAQTGIADAANDYNTQVTSLASDSTTGSTFIQEVDALIITDVTISIHRVDDTALDANLTTVNDMNDSINSGGALVLVAGGAIETIATTGAMTAEENIYVASDATATLGEALTSIAGNITIEALAIDQNSNISTLTNAKTIDLYVDTGSITMAQGVETKATNGDIRLDANDSIITERITTTGNVSLIAQTGSITDLDENSLVSANALNLQAQTDIADAANDYNTQVTSLASDSTTGSTFIEELDDLIITDVTVSVNIVDDTALDVNLTPITDMNDSINSAGALVLVAGGAIETIATTGAMTVEENILIGSGATVTLGETLTSTAGNITIDAQTAISQNANISTLTDSRTIDMLAQSGNIVMAQDTTTAANKGDIRLQASDSIVTELITTTADVSLIAQTGSITDLDGDSLLSANALNLQAQTDIAGAANDYNTQVTSLASDSTTGSTFIEEVDDLIITDVSITVDRVDDTALDVNLTPITDTNDSINSAGALVLVAGGSIETIATTGAMTAEENVLIASGATVTLGETLTSTAGNITIDAQTAIRQNANISTLTDAKTIDLLVQAGSITMGQSAETKATNGDIRLEANDSIITERISTTGNVSLIAKSGSITDLDSRSLVSANALNLQAQKNIANAGNKYDTKVTTLASDSTSGSTFIEEVDDLIIKDVTVSINRVDDTALDANLTTITDTNDSINAAGDLVLVAGGTLEIPQGAYAYASDITLDSQNFILSGRVESTGDVFITVANNMIQSGYIIGGGTVNVLAQNVTMNGGASVITNGNITYVVSQSLLLGLLETSSDVDLNVGGMILDNNGAAMNIRANHLQVDALGFGTKLDLIQTDIASLNASVGTGGIFVLEYDDVIITGIMSLGDVYVQSLTGSIDFNGNITGANITLIALDTIYINRLLLTSGEIDLDARRIVNSMKGLYEFSHQEEEEGTDKGLDPMFNNRLAHYKDGFSLYDWMNSLLEEEVEFDNFDHQLNMLPNSGIPLFETMSWEEYSQSDLLNDDFEYWAENIAI